MTETIERLTAAHAALAGAVVSGREVLELTDADILDATARAEALARHVATIQARLAGDLARRSHRDLGNSGLAATLGHLNPAALLHSLTRTSFTEAARLIRVGLALNHADTHCQSVTGDASAGREGEAETAQSVPVGGAGDTDVAVEAGPSGSTDAGSAAAANSAATATATSESFQPILAAVATGELGIDAADRVIRTLGTVAAEVDPLVLRQATATLAREAVQSTTDQVGALARGLRDTLDRAGVPGREEQLRAKRYLRRSRVVDGLRRVSLLLDPESDVILTGAIDAAMSPRLGGPRFTDPAAVDRSAALVGDTRTNDQLALDTLVDLVRLGIDRDDGTLLSATKLAVRVTISLSDLQAAAPTSRFDAIDPACTGAVGAVGAVAEADAVGRNGVNPGVAWLEGSTELVSAATARRYLCEQGALPVILGGASQPLDLGTTRRLFSAAQRVCLAVRDGGCRWPGCDRPPSWCESHHINHYSTGGKTNVADGMLLCRRHHLILHNNGWQITRDRTEYRLWPPPNVDSARKPITLPTKSPLRV